MIRFISLLVAAGLFLQSCQKDFPFEELPVSDKGCRLSKMTWKYDSMDLSTFSFNYDSLKRISSITDAPYEDTLLAFYEGTSTKLRKIRFSQTPIMRPETEVVYDANNQLTDFTTSRFKSKMFYKAGKLDSADLYAKVRSTDPDWEIFRHYNFFYNQGNSIIGYKREHDGYGDSSRLEYFNVKNPLRYLMFFNADNFLSLEQVFPLSYFGYINEFLLKKEIIQTYHLRPYLPIPFTYGKEELELTYDFDETNNLRTIELKTIANGVLFSTQKFQFYYECK